MDAAVPAAQALEITVLEAVNHIVSKHPNLVSPIATILRDKSDGTASLTDRFFALNQSLLANAKSQLMQDIFVLSELGYKRNGYFVEFGAASGVHLSNSYLLEQSFGWTGILAEPAKRWHPLLAETRKCAIEHDCVWSRTGETLVFNEVAIGEISTIDSYSDSDLHSELRKSGVKYEVKTISLMDLLAKYNAPTEIDYLSIDTEGSEFEILNAFDFDRYNIKIITAEHNHTPSRDAIFELLSRNGYVRKHEALSDFDDWYVRR